VNLGAGRPLTRTACFRPWLGVRTAPGAGGVQVSRSSVLSKLSKDPLFIDKVRDVVALYLHPPETALVLCVDEKSQIQALDRTQPVLPMRPGQVERRTHDYTRYGTTSLFAALNVKTGTVIGECYPQRRAREFRKFLDVIEAAVPADFDVHLILDNYATHKTAVIRRWLAKRPRYHLHLTPTSASWLNLVEPWFATAHGQADSPRLAPESSGPHRGDQADLAVTNETPKPPVWTKTADEILASVARFCRRISDSGH
jgi:transposase